MKGREFDGLDSVWSLMGRVELKEIRWKDEMKSS